MNLQKQFLNPEEINEDFFKRLEEKFLTYQDLKNVSVLDCGESLVDVAAYGIAVHILETHIPASTGDRILVRQSIAVQLVKANEYLKKQHRDLSLQIFYGYRSEAIQQAAFQQIAAKLGYAAPFTIQQLENIHRFVAVPDVAGHPTGGAVDVTIIGRDGVQLDMGTEPHDFQKNSHTFSPFIPRSCQTNRSLLRHAMLRAGFAPFDGEWWHFSYGDREWAKYYRQPSAFYACCSDRVFF